MFSTISGIRHLIATDPCYVIDKGSFDDLLQFKSSFPLAKLPTNIIQSIRTFINIPVTESLYQFLSELNDTSHSFDTTLHIDEPAYVFGESSKDLSDYELIGCHGSDSRMTCLISSDPFKSESNLEHLNVDWSDFVMTTLNDPSLQVDKDNFPIYFFFGKIPNEDNNVAIFGLPKDGNDKCYKGILIRSLESFVEM